MSLQRELLRYAITQVGSMLSDSANSTTRFQSSSMMEPPFIFLKASANALRPEVPTALEAAKSLGSRQIELLTGNNERTRCGAGRAVGSDLPRRAAARKQIEIVKECLAIGHTVLMVGYGVNDAPTLAHNIGIAMGAAGTGYCPRSRPHRPDSRGLDANSRGAENRLLHDGDCQDEPGLYRCIQHCWPDLGGLWLSAIHLDRFRPILAQIRDYGQLGAVDSTKVNR